MSEQKQEMAQCKYCGEPTPCKDGDCTDPCSWQYKKQGLPAGIEANTPEHVEWLLKERVEIIAPWPGMPKWYGKGTILEKEEGRGVTMIYLDQEFSATCEFKELADYPHLFRRLEWHEHRSPEQMPGCVKDKRSNEVRMVQKYDLSFPCYYSHIICQDGPLKGQPMPLNLPQTTPATAAEYEKGGGNA